MPSSIAGKGKNHTELKKALRKKLNSGINRNHVYFNLQQFFLHADIQKQYFALDLPQ